jgi:hypothetical protein
MKRCWHELPRMAKPDGSPGPEQYCIRDRGHADRHAGVCCVHDTKEPSICPGCGASITPPDLGAIPEMTLGLSAEDALVAAQPLAAATGPARFADNIVRDLIRKNPVLQRETAERIEKSLREDGGESIILRIKELGDRTCVDITKLTIGGSVQPDTLMDCIGRMCQLNLMCAALLEQRVAGVKTTVEQPAFTDGESAP